MRAVVFPEIGRWEVAEVPEPTIGPGRLLLSVGAAGICGTDLHIWNWDAWARKTIPVPMVVGHEFAGEVIEVGREVSGVKISMSSTRVQWLWDATSATWQRSVYNKAHFETAGLDPENPPATWEAFIEACEKLKAAGITPISGGLKDGPWGEWFMGHSIGQNLDSPDRKSTRLNSSHVKRSRMPSSA